jgi:murein DD-endopeptidase MepM/ murein hydrolase activator NlpD
VPRCAYNQSALFSAALVPGVHGLSLAVVYSCRRALALSRAVMICRSLERSLLLVTWLAAVACAASPPPAAAPAPCPSLPPPAPSAATETQAKSRRSPQPVVAAFDATLEQIETARCDALHARFNANMKQALSLDKIQQVCADLAKAGPFERWQLLSLRDRTAEFAVFGKAELRASLSLDEQDQIAGLKFAPPPPPPPPVAKTSTELRLPFEGEWHVFWGGATLRDNKHITHKNQLRASDLLVLNDEGKSHTGDGKKNSDYLAYRKKVLAAGAGTVVHVIDGVPDNEPGTLNQYSALGNAVIVKHAEGEYAVYAHLVPGSIRVKPKMRVRAGQLLGLCGNSGNSSEPHLHFHVQDGADLATAVGLEPVFGSVRLKSGGAGQTLDVKDYTFKKGDRIAPKP